MNLLKLFKKNKDIIPKPGEKWRLKNDSPWPKNYQSVIILDVKDSWVRYDINSLFMDQRLKLKSFLYCYEKVI